MEDICVKKGCSLNTDTILYIKPRTGIHTDICTQYSVLVCQYKTLIVMAWVNLLQQLYSAVFINQLVFNDALKLQKNFCLHTFTAFHKVEPQHHFRSQPEKLLILFLKLITKQNSKNTNCFQTGFTPTSYHLSDLPHTKK